MSFLRDIHPELALRTKNGRRINNLYQLASELAAMDEEIFRYHVTEQRNDFANWIQHIVRDEHLARVLASIKDRRLMFAAVEKRIQDLESPTLPASAEHPPPLHFTLKHYLLGIVVGAVAMLMITRLL